MTRCILCPNSLDSTVKPEHVWLASLGGRKTTRRALCSACNQKLGSGPDKALAESVALVRNLMNFPSAKGGEPPTIKGQSSKNAPIALQPGGVPVLKGGPPFTITPRGDGNFDVELRVTSLDQLNRILPDLAGALNMPEADVRRMLSGGSVRRVAQRVETQHHQLSLGGTEAMRSMLKTCLTLWADRHGTEELDKHGFAQAKQYVLAGGDDLARLISRIDPSPLPEDAGLVEKYGKHYNFACAVSDANGRVVGYFRLYNLCAWRFTLSETDGVPSAVAGLVSNPEDPRIWSELNALDAVQADHILKELPEFDLGHARSSLVSMYAAHQQAASTKEIDRICELAAAKLGITADAPMTAQQLDSFVRDVSARMASWILGLPHEEILTPDELARAINDSTQKP